MVVEILDESGNVVLKKKTFDAVVDMEVSGVCSWSCEDPCRYICRVSLMRNDQILDTQEVKFGFRTAEFRENGFYLNGEKVFLRGLNRHPCRPYMGYAAPESLQREDARILKEELGWRPGYGQAGRRKLWARPRWKWEVRCHRGKGYTTAMNIGMNDVLICIPKTPLFSYQIL